MRVAFGVPIWTGLFLAIAASSATNAAPAEKAAPNQTLNVLKYDLAANQDTPELCFLFDGRIARTPGSTPDPHIVVEPALKLTTSVQDQRLCLSGFTFGANYTISLKAGLAGVSAALAKDAQFQIMVPDRPPEFDFANPAADILPRLPQQGLPIRSVNTPKIAIDLFFINDRDLISKPAHPRLTASEAADFAPLHGEHIWHGTLEPKGAVNRDTVTDLPILTAIGQLKPGLYVATATAADMPPGKPDQTQPTQYFMVSDLGLTAYAGSESLLVSVRSLSTAAAAAAVDVALIAANNRELARVRSDGNGFARFDPAVLQGVGGDRPKAIHAFGSAGEFSALDIAAPTQSRNIQARITLDRDTVRPGDTAFVTTFVRDQHGSAVQRQPLTITLVSPEGVAVDTNIVAKDSAGGFESAIDVPIAAQSGLWSVRAAIAGQTIGETGITVERGTPSNLAVSLAAGAAVLDPNQPGSIEIQASHPDAPAEGIPGELKTRVTASGSPFPAFSDFSFGLAQDAFEAPSPEESHFTTDAKGKASVALKPIAVPGTTRPVEAFIATRVFDAAGRPVDGKIEVPLVTQPLFFGLKAVGGPIFPSKQSVHFEAIAVGPDGAKQDRPDADWEIVRESAMPSWSWSKGTFAYRPVTGETRIVSGKLDIAAGAPAAIAADLPDGSYRIELFDSKGEAASSLRFTVGWTSTASDQTAIVIKPSKAVFAPGENAEIFVKPPFESDVTFVVADSEIRTTLVQHLPEAGGTVRIDFPQDVAAGAYVFASAVAPLGTKAPRKASGFAWLPADPAPHRLNVKLDAPDKIQPGQPANLSMVVSGTGDDPAFATVTVKAKADPDESKSDDNPLDLFFAAPPPAIKETDLYGRIITTIGSQPANPRNATRQATKSPGETPSRETGASVSYRSGIVPVDKSGKLAISLPAFADFSGKLDAVVSVWTANRVGGAKAQIAISDPLAVRLPLPRFMRPDDRADITLSLDNTDGPRGEYRIAVTAQGALTIPEKTEIVANLAEHEQRTQSLTIQAHGAGDGKIAWSVTGPGGIAFRRDIDVPVRLANWPVARQQATALKPTASLAIDPALTAGLRPETIVTSLSVAAAPGLDSAGLARQLAIGNQNSVDEITSAAFAAVLSKTSDPSATAQAQHALSVRQSQDGGFSPWGSGPSDPFLSAYVLDFLTHTKAAAAEEAAVRESLQRGLDYLALRSQAVANQDPGAAITPADLEGAAYANAVLAKAGRIDLFRLRFFTDRFVEQMHAPLAVGWTAAAFGSLGDKETAATLFAKAAALPNPVGAPDAYASDLRDQAAFAAILSESGIASKDLLTAARAKTAILAATRRQFAAQEAAWMLRAGPTTGGDVKLKAGDKTIEQTGPFIVSAKAGGEALPPIKNLMTAPLNAALTVTGVPTGADAKDNGYELQRFFFDNAGKPVDPANLKQNDLLIVVLTGRFTGQGEAHPVLTDPTPAGWTIEAAEIPGVANRFPWLKDLTAASHIEARHGRYLAAPILNGDRHEFKLAYVVRATVKGQFALPGALIEDGVQPALSARTPSGKTKIDTAE